MNQPQAWLASRSPVLRPPPLFGVVWAFVAVVVGLFTLVYFSIQLLSGVRAYVEGEGLWSKGQKDAVYALSRYILYADERDFLAYQTALAVNLGDRRARLELEKPDPDLAVAREGLLQGRNHPDDVDGMIFLFRRFRRLPEIDRAITIWTTADTHIEALTQTGERVRTGTRDGTLTSADRRELLARLHAINGDLTPLEDAFSSTLGQAARKFTGLILLFLGAAVTVMLVLAYQFSRRRLQQNAALQEILHQGEEQLRNVLQFAPLPIVIVRSADERVVYVNEHARRQFGLGTGALDGLHPRNLYADGRDRDAMLTALIEGGGSVQDREILLQDIRGTRFWAQYSSRRITYDGQECVMTALLNIDERKRAHDEFRYRAYHDELTGLANRAMFVDNFRRTLSRLERSQGSCSLLFIDLDQFKSVNDQLGHEMGDLLLQQVAQRIEDCVRAGDLVARLGGDEFVVLVEGPDDVESMAQKIRLALSTDYRLGVHTRHVTASIGISRFPENGTDLNELLSAADLAMYRAKTGGSDSVKVADRGH
jgi:diguanylate cyclase (GGDEF)-like protein/PAS domain S-box-containing protein